MRAALVAAVLVVTLTGCSGCVPAKVRESVDAGVARSRRAVELLDQGQRDGLEAYVRAEAKDWAALKAALEE